jgi:hypothetical protein
MPLSSAKPTLKAALLSAYSNTKNATAKQKANELANAVYATLTQAIPQTIVNGNAAPGQVVAGFVTTTPSAVTGSGTGGLDKSAGAKGLAAGKQDFIKTMEASYKDSKLSADKAAQTLTDAIIKLFGEAKIMTNVSGVVSPGAAVPAPVGPVAPFMWTGTGKGGIETTAGTGLVVAKLAKALEDIFKTTPKDHKEAATKWADALIAFAKTASITTTDKGQAGGGTAAVTPPSGSGSTLSPSPLIASTGTGFVT